MGLGLHVLAGAIQGAGKGMQMQAENDVYERRQAALAKLRQEEAVQASELRKSEKTHEYGLQDDLDASKTVRSTNATLTLKGADQQFARETAREGAAAKAASEKAEREHDITMERLRQNGEVKKLLTQRETEWGKPIDTFTSDTGDVTVVYRGGRTETIKGAGQTAKAPASSSTPDWRNRTGSSDGKLPRAATPDFVWDTKTGTFKPAGEN